MRKTATFLVTGGQKRIPLEQEWNGIKLAPEHDMVCGAISIDIDHADYRRFLALLERYIAAGGVSVASRSVSVEYTEEELQQFPLLEVGVQASLPLSKQSAQSFREVALCTHCGRTEIRQTHSLSVDIRKLDADIAMVHSGSGLGVFPVAVIVSHRLQMLLGQAAAECVAFREILEAGSTTVIPNYSQLFVLTRMPSLAKTMKVEQEGICAHCREFFDFGISMTEDSRDRELRFERSEYDGHPIALTEECRGEQRRICDARRRIVMSQFLFRTIDAANINGLGVAPAHFATAISGVPGRVGKRGHH